eukprot:maker-scaffold383_size189472-snap-gene-0.33 protein:Tk11345 transcript:maker-scaffold383_size189472-snap-gene-0.33-mRNA-1 annotation:"conserved hypothetical protein"
MADLPDCLRIGQECKVAYADDVSIWAVGKDFLLDQQAESFARFAAGNRLNMNASKTQLMLGGKLQRADLEDFHVVVDGVTVFPDKKLELLKFDSSFSTFTHGASVAASAIQRAAMIARLSHHLPRSLPAAAGEGIGSGGQVCPASMSSRSMPWPWRLGERSTVKMGRVARGTAWPGSLPLQRRYEVDQVMPSSYQSSRTTTTTTYSSQGAGGTYSAVRTANTGTTGTGCCGKMGFTCNTYILRTPTGLLKILEIVLILLCLIFLRIGNEGYPFKIGDDGDHFLAVGTFVGYAIIVPSILITYLLGANLTILELFINLIGATLFFTTGALSLVNNKNYGGNRYTMGLIIGILSIAAGVVFLIDFLFAIKNTRVTVIQTTRTIA